MNKLAAITSAATLVLILSGTSLAQGSPSVSFRPPVNYSVGSNPIAVAVGDFNNDGKPDLAVVNAGGTNANDAGDISILLGNGDGTYQSALNFTDGNNPTALVAADTMP